MMVMEEVVEEEDENAEQSLVDEGGSLLCVSSDYESFPAEDLVV